MTYIERFEKVVRDYPDRLAFDDGERTLTYRELDEESGKIYSYLKKQGIGREDTVQIIPDRGVGAVACIIGALKAGACFIPGESDYPAQRLEFIRRDAGCRLVIDQKLYTEIIDNELPLTGHEETGLHDAAYIIYTSGSTGNPKGVVHEYGNIEQQASLVPEEENVREYKEGMIIPFYFVLATQFLIHYTLRAYTVYIISHDMVRDFRKLSKFVEDKRLQGIYLSPSYIRLYKEPSPYLEEIVTCSEPANGIYYPGGKPVLYNLYAMSEAGFNVTGAVLDKAYDVAPVGKPLLEEIDVHLVDDDGKRIEGPGTGEFCFRNTYVRGYLNLPERTAAAFQNGVYHTGDICRRDGNGMYYVMGRKDDMFKINGNRIEPAEIEKRVKEATGLEDVHAKGFQEDGRAFIVLYYLIPQAKELGIYKDGRLECDMSLLQKTLPDYMIPSYYVGLESFPINANGKLNRMALKAPQRDAYQGDYVEPANEEERFFCKAMQEVLNIKRVGAEDDFYGIGGDSLGAMQLIMACSDAGYEISVGTLYRCRTPRRLAAALKDLQCTDDIASQEEQARRTARRVNELELVYLKDYEEHPQSTYYNLPELYELKEDVELEKLKAALQKVIKAHPVILSKFIRLPEGEYGQVYEPSLFKEPVIEDISDEEFEALKPALDEPMQLVDGRLYSFRLFRTQTKKYFFLNLHHSIADGTSVSILRNQLYECYIDMDYVIPKDYYYYEASLQDSYRASENFKEAEKYYGENILNKVKDGACGCILKPDKAGPDIGNGLYRRKGYPRFGDGRNNLRYMAAFLLAMADMNGENAGYLNCVYHGRDDLRKNNSIGLYARGIPIFYEKEGEQSPEQILKLIQEQMNFGMAHCDYYFEKCLPTPEANTVIFNYQKNTLNIGKIGGLVAGRVPLPKNREQKNGSAICGMIDLDMLPDLTLYCAYSEGYYSKEYWDKFAQCFDEELAFFKENP